MDDCEKRMIFKRLFKFPLLWILVLFVVTPPTSVVSFVIRPQQQTIAPGIHTLCHTRNSYCSTTTTSSSSSTKCGRVSFLAASSTSSSVDISTPTPEEAANMGVRDWPQQVRQGEWEEQVNSGTTLVRYVLDGTGVVEITTNSNNNNDTATTKQQQQQQRISVGPGSLVEVTGEASMSWKASTAEMIILTPGFEEGGKLVGVALAMIVLCGALVAGLGSS